MNTAFSQKRGKLPRAHYACALLCVLVFSFFSIPPRSAFAVVGVPVVDFPNTTQNTITAGKSAASLIVQGKSLVESTLQTAKTYAAHFKEWVGDGLVKYIAQTTLRGITQSIVNWINNDFQGSPSFVTNPEGFMTNLADKVIGRTIQQIDPLWCEPFRLQLRVAFGVGFGFNTNEEVNCRLTDVIANVQGAYDSFVGGNFNQGGWKNWISITGNQQNNGYGAYLNTVDKVDASIVTASGREIKLLDWGQGFRSWKKCLEPGPDVEAKTASGERILQADESTPVMKPGPCKKEGPIETPGSIIQDNLKQALGSDLMGLNLADEINEIVAALANVMIRKVMADGVGEASDYVSADYDSGTRVTAGNCDPTDPKSPLNQKNQKSFNPETGDYSPAYVDAFQVRCNRTSHNFALNVNADDLFKSDAQKDQEELLRVASGEAPTSTPRRVANAVNEADAQGNAVTQAAGASAGAGAVVRDTNIAVGKKSEQSQTYFEKTSGFTSVFPASNGNNESDADMSIAQMGQQIPQPWWEVDLGTDTQGNLYEVTEVNEVRIFRPPSQTKASDNLLLFLSDTRMDSRLSYTDATARACPTCTYGISKMEVPLRATQPGDVAQVVITDAKDKKKRFLRLYQKTDQYLALGDVRVMGKHKKIEQERPSGTPTFDVLFSPAAEDILVNDRNPEPNDPLFKAFRVNVPRDISGVSFRVKFYEQNAPTSFTNRFLDFHLSYRAEGSTERTDVPNFIAPSVTPRAYNPALKDIGKVVSDEVARSPNDVLFPGGSVPANLSAGVVMADKLSLKADKALNMEFTATLAPAMSRTFYRVDVEALKENLLLGRASFYFQVR